MKAKLVYLIPARRNAEFTHDPLREITQNAPFWVNHKFQKYGIDVNSLSHKTLGYGWQSPPECRPSRAPHALDAERVDHRVVLLDEQRLDRMDVGVDEDVIVLGGSDS